MTCQLVLEGVIKRRESGDSSVFSLAVTRFVVGPGDAIAVLGESGSGKSTLIELLGLVLSPDSGRIQLREQDGTVVDVAALWQRRRYDTLAKLRARRFGYVPQTGSLLPFLRVGENIVLRQRLAGHVDPGRLRESCALLDISDLHDRLPREISIGQRQRVAIARAVAHAPAFILADEPTAALDPANAERVMDLLVQAARWSGAGLVVVSHDRLLLERFGLHPVMLDSHRDGSDWSSSVPVHEAAA